MGTACNLEHLKILSRYIKTLYVLYDGDQAGQKAILRLTQFCWNVNLDLQIIKLPKKEDPDSFLNQSGDLNKLTNESSDIFTFFIESLGKNYSQCSLSEKLNFSKNVVQIIIKQDDSFKQELLLQKASSVMQISFSVLKKYMMQQKNEMIFSKDNGKSKTVDSTGINIKNIEKNMETNSNVSLLEERIFSAIINSVDKKDRFYIETSLILYFSEYIQFLYQKLDNFIKKVNCESKYFDLFINDLSDFDKNWVVRCSLKFEQNVSKDLFDQLIFLFCKQNWKQIVRDIRLKLSDAKQQNNREKIKELFILFSKLKNGIQDRGLI